MAGSPDVITYSYPSVADIASALNLTKCLTVPRSATSLGNLTSAAVIVGTPTAGDPGQAGCRVPGARAGPG